jgi:hypothetical protein
VSATRSAGRSSDRTGIPTSRRGTAQRYDRPAPERKISDMAEHDEKQTRDEFADAVNMTASELEKWLDSDESKSVGQKKNGSSESTGHESGRHIVRILEKKQGDYTDADYAHMRKVVSYVARHAKQRPKGDVEDSAWRYSLMNWGHDPEKR